MLDSSGVTPLQSTWAMAGAGIQPSNKGMKLTRPGGGESGVGALQLNPRFSGHGECHRVMSKTLQFHGEKSPSIGPKAAMLY